MNVSCSIVNCSSVNKMDFLYTPKRPLDLRFGGFRSCERDNHGNLLPYTSWLRKLNVKAPPRNAKHIPERAREAVPDTGWRPR